MAGVCCVKIEENEIFNIVTAENSLNKKFVEDLGN